MLAQMASNADLVDVFLLVGIVLAAISAILALRADLTLGLLGAALGFGFLGLFFL